MNTDYIATGELFSERYILPRHLGISSRQVNYWKERVILPFFEKEKYGKMNIPQAVWLYAINELTKLGIDTKRLAQLAKDVWDLPREEKYLDSIFEYHLNKKVNRLDDVHISSLKIMLDDELLMNTLRTENNPFTDAIKASIYIEKSPSSLLYFPNTGEHTFIIGDITPTLKLNSLMNQETSICIPLIGFIKKIVTIEFEMIEGDLAYLSQIENQLKDIILFKSPKYIELVIDNEKIKPLIITEQHKKGEQLANFILSNKLPKNSKLLIEPRSQDNYKLTLITK
ncbi:hypothetical protein BST83_18625 [Polaribacter filamentus]|uniref:Uncharacterized protein n=1 Tax=Polaribacter filamentus TaxID=53483 RepID=A0A2S7KL24_9FLAO|nr:hypothetical protein [Polaribacter filamentus]PQB03317.1 hypothetical protein BST83_18625 [Polaribacter filamentus]